MTVSFFIPGHLPGMNEIVAAANRNRFVYNSMKRRWTDTIALIAKAHVKAQYTAPVDVQLTWHMRDRKRDPDNVRAGVKFILDGLVAAKVLEGDGVKHIASISDRFELDPKRPGVTVALSA